MTAERTRGLWAEEEAYLNDSEELTPEQSRKIYARLWIRNRRKGGGKGLEDPDHGSSPRLNVQQQTIDEVKNMNDEERRMGQTSGLWVQR